MEAVVSYLLGVSPWMAAMVIVSIAIWKLSKYHSKLEEANKKMDNLPCEDYRRNIESADRKFEKLEEWAQKIGNLPCEKHHDELLKRKVSHDELNKTVKSTNEMVTTISKWIMKLDNKMIDALAQKASPLKITPIGEILFEQSHAKRAVDENLEFLLSELDEYNPKTAFDVEDKAWSVLFRNIGHDMFTDIKQYIYYAPETIKIKDPITQKEEDVQLSIQSIIKLMGIYLRDKYLEKYPEIVSDADQEVAIDAESE